MPKLRVAILEMKFQRLSNGLQSCSSACIVRHDIPYKHASIIHLKL